MNPKTLDNTNVAEARRRVNDLQVYGDGDTFALLCKVSSQEQGWMKSTKVMNVPGGCVVQVTTQQCNPDGSHAIAEALTYVPNTHIDTSVEPRRLVACDVINEDTAPSGITQETLYADNEVFPTDAAHQDIDPENPICPKCGNAYLAVTIHIDKETSYVNILECTKCGQLYTVERPRDYPDDLLLDIRNWE